GQDRGQGRGAGQGDVPRADRHRRLARAAGIPARADARCTGTAGRSRGRARRARETGDRTQPLGGRRLGARMPWHKRVERWFEASVAAASHACLPRWGAIAPGYRRPYARLAVRLKFAFYPLLAVAALGWLAWDWHHDRSRAAAEDAIFDTVIGLRPAEPKP